MFAAELIIRVALAWGVICALLLVTSYGAIAALRIPDPDDARHLMQVRGLLAGQGWFDAGGGVPMNWSRLADMPLAAAVWFLSMFMAQATAEIVAAVIVPLATLGIAMLLAGRVAWRLVGAEAAGFACLAMALSVPLISHMRPLRIDHHGWQIILALLAVNGLMARSPRLGGWLTGFALAIWVSISVEGLPLAIAICGIAALRWVRERRASGWLVHVTGSLAVSSAAIFAATRGFSDLALHCDAISPVHLAIFAWGASGAYGLSRCEPIPRIGLLSGLGLILTGAAAILFHAAPQCVGGGIFNLDPLASESWSRSAGEAMPVWRQSFGLALQIIVPPVIGLLAALKLAAQSNNWLRQWWCDYALLLAASLLAAIFAASAGSLAAALAAVPLGWQITQWLRQARNMRRPSRRVLALAGTALVLMPALPLALLTIALTMAAPARASLDITPPLLQDTSMR